MNQRKIGIVLSYFYTILHIIINLIYVPLLLRLIGKTEYGLYQMVGSMMAYITIMESLLSSGILRYYCKYHNLNNEEKKENILAISQKIYRILSLIMIGLGFLFICIFRKTYINSLNSLELFHATIMMGLLIINIVINLNTYIYTAAIIANEKFIFIRLVSILTTLLQPILVIILIERKPYAVFVIIVQLITNFFICVLKKYYCVNRLKVKVKYHKKDVEFMKHLFTFSMGIFMAAIADQIFWKADQLIIGKILNTEYVAIYAIGAQIYLNYPAVGTAISGVFMNRLSELYDKEKNIKKVSDLFIRVGRLSFILLMFVLTAFTLYGKEFIYIWTGSEYEEAYYIALVVMIPFTIDIMQNLGLSILQIMNKYSFRGKMYLFMAVLNIISTIWLVKYLGIIGAAISTSFSMLIGNGIIMNYYYRKIGLDINSFWKEILKIFPSVIISLLIGYLVSLLEITNKYMSFIFHIIEYTIIYFLFIFYFGTNQYEKNLAYKALIKMKILKY